MAEEVAPSTGAWQNVRAKIEKKDGWLESLGDFLSNQKWQGVAITAMVVVVAVSVTVWQISGAGQKSLVTAPAPPAGNASVVSTAPKFYDTTTPPPAQVTVNPPSVTVPAPSPAPAPTAPPPPAIPPPVTPPATTPPVTTAPPPSINVGAPPPPQVTVQAPPPAQVTVQAPPPASYPGPIVAVSVSGPLEPITPGGPRIEITLKNISNEPVANLTAILELNKPFQFAFSVLLAPGESTST